MITGNPSRRIPVGPQAPAAVEPPPESPVTNYLVGRFEYYSPRYRRDGSKQIKVGKRGIYVSTALTDDLLKAVPECTRVQIGVDPERCLVEIKPTTEGSKVNLKSKDRKGLCVVSTALSKWLTSMGVPDTYFPARWQSETQSIVGRYVPVETGAQTDEPKLKEDPGVIVACGHRWQLTEYVSPGGGSLYRCVVCGYFTSDLRNPVLKQRACKPGIYEGRYQIRDGVVYPASDANWGGKGRRAKGKGDDKGEVKGQEAVDGGEAVNS